MTQAIDQTEQELTPFQVQLAGEDMGRFHQKDAFLGKVFETTCQFLKLKPYNSVRIVFRLHFEGPLAQSYPLGSPAIVRMRISRLASPNKEVRLEWRLASAKNEHTDSHVQLPQIDACFVGNHNGPTAIGFLGQEFGQGVEGWRWHFPHVSKIETDLALREPLGVLAVMRGNSDLVEWRPTGVVDPHKSLLRVDDAPALYEP